MNRTITIEDLDHVCELIAPFMQMWRGARILVTGASGFFGTWLVETFHHVNKSLDLGAELIGVGAPSEDFACVCPQLLDLRGVVMVNADIQHLKEDLRAVLRDRCTRIDAVIHAAIHVDGTTYDRVPLATLDTAIDGTRQALELARIAQTRRFLFVSSGAVYGAQGNKTLHVGEDHACDLDPADPRSAYAEGKRVGETLCAAYLRQHNVPITIARPFAFIGPHLPLERHFAVGNFVRDALAGESIVIQSDGKPVRSYLYAADLAVWLWAILCKAAVGRPYNVGSERAISLAEMAQIVSQAVSPSVGVEVRGASSSSPPSRYVPSTARARSELELAETVPLEDAIGRTLAWHQQAT